VPRGRAASPSPPARPRIPDETKEAALSTRSIRRLVALGAVLGAGVVAVPALAHSPLVGTFPAKGATVSPVRTVTVRFGGDVQTGLISVRRADGTAVRTRAAGLDPRNHARLRATFPSRLGAGRYTVSWRARADDGHSQRGTFSFRVR
jgi:methionine-rich copper-binding protein CopC